MQHWFVDREAVLLPSWAAAIPAAIALSRAGLSAMSLSGDGILWCRLRAGESVAALIAEMPVFAGRRLVVLADEPDEAVVVQVLSAGGLGCCNTHAAPDVVQQVALVVGHGGLWVGQSLLQQLVGSASRILGQRPVEQKRDNWAELLSEREVEVARLVAGGASNKEVAARLAITERTVKAHLGAIFDKLSLRDRLQLSLRVNGMAA